MDLLPLVTLAIGTLLGNGLAWRWFDRGRLAVQILHEEWPASNNPLRMEAINLGMAPLLLPSRIELRGLQIPLSDNDKKPRPVLVVYEVNSERTIGPRDVLEIQARRVSPNVRTLPPMVFRTYVLRLPGRTFSTRVHVMGVPTCHVGALRRAVARARFRLFGTVPRA